MLGGMLHDVVLLLRYDVLNGTTSARRERRVLCEAEALASFVDRQQELLSKHLIRRVLRKIDLVEACKQSEFMAQDMSAATYMCAPVGDDRHRRTPDG